jgi:hypothetical protein
MDTQARQQETLQRLHRLADQPDEQVRFALHLLDRQRGRLVISQALAIVSAAAVPEARPPLLRLYDSYDEAGIKRDVDGSLRSAILTALEPIAHALDRSLAERAAMTFEFLPPKHEESAGELRAAGLVLLKRIDPVLASYHAVRLLNDPHTSRMSGEPAVGAARLLANQGNRLPLYASVLASLRDDQESIPEVVGECLTCLDQAPASVIEGLFALYTAWSPSKMAPVYETKDDLELVGLFDLLLSQAPQDSYLDFIEAFLRTTRRDEVYRYLVTIIVATHQPQVWTRLLSVANRERDPHKVEILLSALAALSADPAVSELVDALQMR